MLTETEITNEVLETNNFNVLDQNDIVKTAFKKILDCIRTNVDILSDGMIIDMLDCYLVTIHADEL